MLHLVGGTAMFALAYQRDFWSFFIVMLIYQWAYMPTMSLTNAICFRDIKDALPWRCYSWRWTMTLGVMAHAARFLVFAIGDPLWLMVSPSTSSLRQPCYWRWHSVLVTKESIQSSN